MTYPIGLTRPEPSAIKSFPIIMPVSDQGLYWGMGAQAVVSPESVRMWITQKSSFSSSGCSESLQRAVVIISRTPPESSSLYSPPSIITDFSDEPYRVIQPIKVEYKLGSPSGIVACFDLANVAAVGQTWPEAFNNLRAEILNTYEDYVEHEPNLGPEPRRQMQVLREFIESISDVDRG